MKRAFRFYIIFLLLILLPGALFSLESVKLQNGYILIFDNKLPKSIAGYFRANELALALNNPGRDSFLKNFPFSCVVQIGYSEADSALYCTVDVPKFDISEANIRLVKSEPTDYLTLDDVQQAFGVIMWWYKSVPHSFEGVDSQLAGQLLKSPINLYATLTNNNVTLGLVFTFSYTSNGILANPLFTLRYPITIGNTEVEPNVKYTNELESFLRTARYPVMIVDKITGRSTKWGGELLNFLKN